MMRVVTETSSYLVNTDEKWVVRVPGDGTTPDDPNVALATLRKDRQEIPLIEIVTLKVGEPMELFLDIRGDGVMTYRRTTTVRAIHTDEA